MKHHTIQHTWHVLSVYKTFSMEMTFLIEIFLINSVQCKHMSHWSNSSHPQCCHHSPDDHLLTVLTQVIKMSLLFLLAFPLKSSYRSQGDVFKMQILSKSWFNFNVITFQNE